MKRHRNSAPALVRPIAAATALALAAMSASVMADRPHNAAPDSQNLRWLGHTDLQGRTAYQPTLHTQLDASGHRHVYLYVGHFGNQSPIADPTSGGALEPNGTSIVDVTDPAHPVEVAHIPTNGGGAQMVRVCSGHTGVLGNTGEYYMLRNNNGGAGVKPFHEIYDVTDPANPKPLSVVVGNLSATHKNWWECDTGIAYIVAGANGKNGADNDGWTTNQHIKVFDLSDPRHPHYIRDIGLMGQNPGSLVHTDTTGVHGPISVRNNPVTGEAINRIYVPYGTESDGVFQILDRTKVLPGGTTVAGQPMGGTWDGTRAQNPTDEDLAKLVVGSMDMTPTEGGHTAFPMFGIPLRHYQGFTSNTTRDIVALISEETGNKCEGSPHFGYLVDTTRAIGADAHSAAENHPMVISTMQVFEDSAKPDFCTRGTRFGNHSTHESFYAPYWGKLLMIANFDAGLRVWDVRDPYHPQEVAHFIPPLNGNIIPTVVDGTAYYDVSTDNAEVDDNGLIYIVDRVGGGADILSLDGCAKQIVDKGASCNANDQ